MSIKTTPSWPATEAAKAAWNAIRVTNASEQEKARVKAVYEKLAAQCMREKLRASGISIPK